MRQLGHKLRMFGIPISAEGAEELLSGEGDGTIGAGAVLGGTHAEFYDARWAGDLDRALEAAHLEPPEVDIVRHTLKTTGYL